MTLNYSGKIIFSFNLLKDLISSITFSSWLPWIAHMCFWNGGSTLPMLLICPWVYLCMISSNTFQKIMVIWQFKSPWRDIYVLKYWVNLSFNSRLISDFFLFWNCKLQNCPKNLELKCYPSIKYFFWLEIFNWHCLSPLCIHFY